MHAPIDILFQNHHFRRVSSPCFGQNRVGNSFRMEIHSRRRVILHFFFFFSFILFAILALLSRSLPVVTQIRSHIAGAPPSSPLARAFILSREEFSILFRRRLASKCAYPRCYALSAVDTIRGYRYGFCQGAIYSGEGKGRHLCLRLFSRRLMRVKSNAS